MTVNLGRFELPNNLVRDEASATPTYAKFYVEPFEKGYGHTIGNSLRRVLLSSIEGAAIRAVKVDGVLHEFSTIPGVQEDVPQMILNLKSVLLQLPSRDPKTLEIKVEKEGDVTAADIKLDAGVEIVNPEQHIAKIVSSTKFHAELKVGIGRGYWAAERNKEEDMPIGLIAIDSIFSPVSKVKYSVEDARVGQMIGFDRLVLEIWTDGRITPEEALRQASGILRKHLDVFVNYDENYIQFEEEPTEEEQECAERDKVLNMSIEEIELSVRAANCIQQANIKTIGELASKTEHEMLKYKNFGKKSLNEIKKILIDLGLSLGMNIDEYKKSVEQEELVES